MIESFKQLCDAWSAFEKAQVEMQKATAQMNTTFQRELSDLSLLPQLYAWYRDVADQNRFSSDVRNGNRKQFVFIVLMLYAPKSLCGGPIGNDLRQEIASLLHLRSHTILYYIRDKAVAWNRTYKTFASEVETAHKELTTRLREQGIDACNRH